MFFVLTSSLSEIDVRNETLMRFFVSIFFTTVFPSFSESTSFRTVFCSGLVQNRTSYRYLSFSFEVPLSEARGMDSYGESRDSTSGFAQLDSLQQMRSEWSRARLAMQEEVERRSAAERVLVESAQQISLFKTNHTQQQRLMAEVQLVALRCARSAVRDMLSLTSPIGVGGAQSSHSLNVSTVAGVNTSVVSIGALSNARAVISLPFSLSDATPQQCAHYAVLSQLVDETGVGAPMATGGGEQQQQQSAGAAVAAAGRCSIDGYKSQYATVLHESCVMEWEHLTRLLCDRLREVKAASDSKDVVVDALRREVATAEHALVTSRAAHYDAVAAVRRELATLQEQHDALLHDWEAVVGDLASCEEGEEDECGLNAELKRIAVADGDAGVVGLNSVSFASKDRRSLVLSAINAGRVETRNLRLLLDRAQKEVCGLKEEMAAELLRCREIFQSAFTRSAWEVRHAAAEFHRGLLTASWEMASRVSLGVTQHNAVQQSLESACGESQRELLSIRAATRRERQVLVANHAVEMTALSQGAAMQQRRLEEMSEKLSKSLAREGQLKRELKAKEGELEVATQLSDQRNRDYLRKSTALEEVRGKLAAKQAQHTAAQEALRTERERNAELKEQSGASTRRVEALGAEVDRVREELSAAEGAFRRDLDKCIEGFTTKEALLTRAHEAELEMLRGELQRASDALAEETAALGVQKEAVDAANREVAVLKEVVNSQSGEIGDMRGELQKAKHMLEEGLRRWSARGQVQQQQHSNTNGSTTHQQQQQRLAAIEGTPRTPLHQQSPVGGGPTNVLHQYTGRDRTPGEESALGVTPNPTRGASSSSSSRHQNHYADPSLSDPRNPNFVPPHHISAVADMTAAALRISQLESENTELRAACEASVNQSVELMEALHRKRGGSADSSFLSNGGPAAEGRRGGGYALRY